MNIENITKELNELVDTEVKIFIGDADEFNMSANDDDQRIYVWVNYVSESNLQKEKLIGKFDEHEDAVNFANNFKQKITHNNIRII